MIVQIECKTSSWLECFAEMQPILCKDIYFYNIERHLPPPETLNNKQKLTQAQYYCQEYDEKQLSLLKFQEYPTYKTTACRRHTKLQYIHIKPSPKAIATCYLWRRLIKLFHHHFLHRAIAKMHNV